MWRRLGSGYFWDICVVVEVISGLGVFEYLGFGLGFILVFEVVV